MDGNFASLDCGCSGFLCGNDRQGYINGLCDERTSQPISEMTRIKDILKGSMRKGLKKLEVYNAIKMSPFRERMI